MQARCRPAGVINGPCGAVQQEAVLYRLCWVHQTPMVFGVPGPNRYNIIGPNSVWCSSLDDTREIPLRFEELAKGKI